MAGEIIWSKVKTTNMIADYSTKALAPKDHVVAIVQAKKVSALFILTHVSDAKRGVGDGTMPKMCIITTGRTMSLLVPVAIRVYTD